MRTNGGKSAGEEGTFAYQRSAIVVLRLIIIMQIIMIVVIQIIMIIVIVTVIVVVLQLSHKV